MSQRSFFLLLFTVWQINKVVGSGIPHLQRLFEEAQWMVGRWSTHHECHYRIVRGLRAKLQRATACSLPLVCWGMAQCNWNFFRDVWKSHVAAYRSAVMLLRKQNLALIWLWMQHFTNLHHTLVPRCAPVLQRDWGVCSVILLCGFHLKFKEFKGLIIITLPWNSISSSRTFISKFL